MFTHTDLRTARFFEISKIERTTSVFLNKMPSVLQIAAGTSLQVVVESLSAILAVLEQLRNFPRVLVHHRLLHGSPEGPLLQGVGGGPHGADALEDVDVGRAGDLHGLAQLGLHVPHPLRPVQADLQDPVVSPRPRSASLSSLSSLSSSSSS